MYYLASDKNDLMGHGRPFLVIKLYKGLTLGDLRKRAMYHTGNMIRLRLNQNSVQFRCSLIYNQISPIQKWWVTSAHWKPYTTHHHYSDVIMSTSASQITDCLLNRLFRRISKKTPKLCVTDLCEWYSPVTGEWPTQSASNAGNVSIWWRHHAEVLEMTS